MPEAILTLGICLPIFALIAGGVWLRRSGKMHDEHQAFILWLVNTFSLPAIISSEIARQDISTLINMPVIVVTLVATLALVGLGVTLVALMRPPPALAGAFIFCAFWANVTYLGFPLSERAYGSAGIQVAAIVNAFAMPVFVLSGIVVMTMTQPSAGANSTERNRSSQAWRGLCDVLSNPIFLSAVAGFACAALVGWTPVHSYISGPIATIVIGACADTLDLIGRLGLPMGLICIGYSLRGAAVQEHRLLLCWTVGGKLLLAPWFTLLAARAFGELPAHDLDVAVMLMATPSAIASYVIGSRLGADRDFLAAHLTLSTALSMLTIPLWLWLLL